MSTESPRWPDENDLGNGEGLHLPVVLSPLRGARLLAAFTVEVDVEHSDSMFPFFAVLRLRSRIIHSFRKAMPCVSVYLYSTCTTVAMRTDRSRDRQKVKLFQITHTIRPA